jgi:hypothetical protein
MRKLSRLCLVAFILVGTGCQAGVSPKPASHEASFSDLWKTYRHCQKSEDPHEMKADALHLDQTVRNLAGEKDATLVPDQLERLIFDKPTRLAVDPQAMAASCALLAGYQARVVGEPGLAAEMFGHVLSIMSCRPTMPLKVLRAASSSFRNICFPPSRPVCRGLAAAAFLPTTMS